MKTLATSRAAVVVSAFIFALLAARTGSATVSPPYQVGVWQGFRASAISFTFDDDCANQYAEAIPMFNAKNLHLTLFTVVNWIPGGSWVPVQNAALHGHEIASHTIDHMDLPGLTAVQQTNELKNSQIAINANIPGQQCITLAYPNCNPPAAGVTSNFYIAARNCSGVYNGASPSDLYSVSCFICGQLGSVKTTQDFTNSLNGALSGFRWSVYLIHGIDNDGGYSPLPSTVLQSAVDYVDANRNKFWVDTFGNVVRYLKERNVTSVSEISSNETTITVQVTNNLDTSIYNFPITLRRPLPTNWTAAVVTQAGKAIVPQIVTTNSIKYVMFDIVPNAGNVLLAKADPSVAVGAPTLASASSFTFQLNGQSGLNYAVYSSSNLTDWQLMQTNFLSTASTNITVIASNTLRFYRAQWAP